MLHLQLQGYVYSERNHSKTLRIIFQVRFTPCSYPEINVDSKFVRVFRHYEVNIRLKNSYFSSFYTTPQFFGTCSTVLIIIMVVLFKTCPPFTQSKLCNRQLQNWQLALDCDTYMMHTSISKLRLLVSHEQHRHAHIDRLGRTAHAPPP